MKEQDTAETHRRNLALMGSGEWMNGFADGILQGLMRCEELCFRLNALPPSRREERAALAREILAEAGEGLILHSPFHCDFGTNIRIGRNFVGNFNLTILDEAAVSIGDNVFIGPDCRLCTVVHALLPDQRNAGVMKARPIRIGHNVWLAAGVTVLPGVSIGDAAVVGAGSVVTKDVPPGVLAMGNPCRVVRELGEDDRVRPAETTAG